MRISDWSSDVCSSDLHVFLHTHDHIPVPRPSLATPSTIAQPPPSVPSMKELFRSNDPVRMSRALGLLEDEGIPAFQMDQHMSVLEEIGRASCRERGCQFV